MEWMILFILGLFLIIAPINNYLYSSLNSWCYWHCNSFFLIRKLYFTQILIIEMKTTNKKDNNK